MPEFGLPDLNDPVVWTAGGALALVVVLVLGLRWWRARREAAHWRARAAELRRERGYQYMQQAEVERLAARVIATSSTPTIAGFRIVRQIEALFTDGHLSPAKAVEVLKALAAEKGGNALVNLTTERGATGKYIARADVMIVEADRAN